MNKICFLISFTCLFLLFSTVSFSQTWKFLGGPEGKVSNDIIFTNSGRLLCSTIDGIFYSDDNGSTWTYSLSSQTFKGFYKLTERINGDLFGISKIGIAKSSNKGENWEVVYEISSLNAYGAYIVESPIDSALYYAADRKLNKSTDGGINWKIIWEGNVIDSYAIDDSGWIYIGERYNGILQSKDEGVSFEIITINYPLYDPIFESLMINNKGGLYIKIFGNGNPILHFENNLTTKVASGYNNRSRPLGISSTGALIYKKNNILMVYHPGSRTSRIVSYPYFFKNQFERKIITKDNIWISDFYITGLHFSSDFGANWSEIATGRGYKTCTSVEITKRGKIIVGTFDGGFWGSLYVSEDDGESWNRKLPWYLDPSLFEIDKLKNGNLIGTGSYGVFIADAEGLNWGHIGLQNVTSHYVSENGIVYAGNEYHGIYKSTNNGINWIETNGNLSSRIYTGFGEGFNNRIFASGYNGGAYYSDDDGATWMKIEDIRLNYYAAYDFKKYDNKIYVGTSVGVMYSEDNGINWETLGELYGQVRNIIIAPNGDIIASLKEKGIYRFHSNLTDKKRWSPFNSTIEHIDVNDLSFDNYYRIIAVSDSGIFRSDEYFSKFLIQSPANNSTLNTNSVQFKWGNFPSVIHYHFQLAGDSLFNESIINDSSITDTTLRINNLDYNKTYYWKVGAKSTIGNIYSEIAVFSINTPANYFLRQNYPNPFNSETTIVFDAPVNDHVKIQVFDVLGNEVGTLIDELIPVGSHYLKFDAKGLASGIYFYSLQAGSNVETKKMVLLK